MRKANRIQLDYTKGGCTGCAAKKRRKEGLAMDADTTREHAQAQAAALQAAEFLHRDDPRIKPLREKRDKAKAELNEAQAAHNARLQELQQDPELQKRQQKLELARKKVNGSFLSLRKELQKYIDKELRDDNGESND